MRRPLVLQLHKTKGGQEYAEFLHAPRKRFSDFRSLSYEAKEAFLAALVSEGRAEWVDKSHKKCLILWLRIQDWANYIVDFVKENGLEVTTIEDIRSGIETHGTEYLSTSKQ
ncbi:Vacuolar protein sorting-associated protein 25 [Hordeum vulgare]|nr:Vacuolar protein sorting-associated protein 25 [Hordeum vulgare]